MDPQFWHQRWHNQEIGFHQAEVHDLLEAHWDKLGVAPGARVFVPLCGKSLDMAWLAERGHEIVGVELSELAIDEFFAERGLMPEAKRTDGFIVKRAGPYELWCGDMFALPQQALAGVGGVYDRAALIAFPPDMQPRYAQALKDKLPKDAPVLLISLEYDQAQMQGPPFAVTRVQVETLLADRYEIKEIARRSALEKNARFKARGLTALEECVYLLRRR